MHMITCQFVLCHQKKQQKKCTKLAALERAAHGGDSGALLIESGAAETESTASRARVESIEMASRS